MELKRKTKLGTLVARYARSDADYPGFWIDLSKSGKPMQPICTVEYEPAEDCIRVIVYGNGQSEEPTDIIRVSLSDEMK